MPNFSLNFKDKTFFYTQGLNSTRHPLFSTGRPLTYIPAHIGPQFLLSKFPRGTLKVHSNTAISLNFLTYLEMNRTLFDCGFKKNLEVKNGGLYDINETLRKHVKMPASDLQCHKCSQSFSRKQHLEIHTKYKHPDVEVDSMDKSTLALNIDSVDLNVQQEASQQEEDRPPHQEKEHAQYRRGRNKHKSYIIEFKK